MLRIRQWEKKKQPEYVLKRYQSHGIWDPPLFCSPPSLHTIISLWDPSAVKNLFINNHLPGMESLDPNSLLNGLSVENPLTCSACNSNAPITLPLCASQSWITKWKHGRDPERCVIQINSQKNIGPKMLSYIIFDNFISFNVQFARNCYFKQKLLNNRPLTECLPHIYATKHYPDVNRSEWDLINQIYNSTVVRVDVWMRNCN